MEDGQTSISSCGEQRTEDNRIARFPDIPEHGSDDGGASSRGGFIREIWQVPEFSERSQVRSNVPANIVEKPTGKGTSQQQMILILISAAILTQSRFHNTAVVEQGSRGQPVVMHQPEEVLASRDGSVGPNAVSESINRSLLHMP